VDFEIDEVIDFLKLCTGTFGADLGAVRVWIFLEGFGM
jgi:hypothetical protein